MGSHGGEEEEEEEGVGEWVGEMKGSGTEEVKEDGVE